MSNPIKEYLVSIGLDLNKTKLQQTQKGIKDTTNLIDKMKQASDFLKRGLNGLTLSMLGLAGASTKLVTSLAKQDQKFETLAQKMFVSRQSVYEYQSAVKALGVTIDEIQFNPTLMKQYKELVSDSRKMFVGKEYQGAMTSIRSFLFEFVRLKQESMYLLQWIGFSIIKNLQIPLEKARLTLQGLNDFIVKNMSKIGDTIGKMIFNVKNFSKSIMDFFGNIIKEVQQFWTSLPSWAKKFIMGTGIIGAIFIGMQNPIIFVSALITGILLLIDDFQKHINGKKAQFGEFWDNLIKWIDKAKKTIYEWKDKAIKWIEEVIGKAKGWIEEIKGKINEKLPEIQEKFKNFCNTVKDGFTAAVEAIKEFRTHMDRLTFFWSMVQQRGFGYAMGRVFSGKFETDFQKHQAYLKRQDEYSQRSRRKAERLSKLKQEFDDKIKQYDIETLKKWIKQEKARGNVIADYFEYYLHTGQLPFNVKINVKTKQEEKAPTATTATVEKPKGYNPNVDQYDHIINYYAMKYGVKQSLLKALLYQESKMNPNAVGRNEDGTPSGALGLAQLMPETAEELGVKDRLNPQQSIMGAAKYLSQLQKRYTNDTTSVLRAYNWGMGNVDLLNQGLIPESAIPQQTRDYVKNINNALAKNLHPWRAENAKYNERPLRPVDKITPIKQKANDTCGVVSVAMANNSINGNNNLNEDNVLSNYGYSLLSALNGTNKNKNIRWKDLGNQYITDTELNEIIKANQQGLPAIAGVAGDFKWGYSKGHFFVITKSDVKQRKLTIVDPATGETYQRSFEWLKNAPQRSDGYGNAVFIPYKIQEQKKAIEKQKLNSAPIMAPITQKEIQEGEERQRQTDVFNMSPEENRKGIFRGWWNGVGNWIKNRKNALIPQNNNIKDLQGATGQYHSNISSPFYVGGINITVNTNSNDPNVIGEAVANNLESRMNYFALNRGLGLGAV